MQEEYLRIECHVVDADDQENLTKLAKQLSHETVTYSRGAYNWSWPLLPDFSPGSGKAPWVFTFVFTAEAVRILELTGDHRMEQVKYLQVWSKRTHTMH